MIDRDAGGPDNSAARARGLRALEEANDAFAKLPDEYVEAVAQDAIRQARRTLREAPFAAMNVVQVTRRSRQDAPPPPTMSFVQNTPQQAVPA